MPAPITATIHRLLSNQGTQIRAFIRAFIAVLTAFGLKLSAEQVASIMVLVEAFLALAGGWYRKSPT